MGTVRSSASGAASPSPWSAAAEGMLGRWIPECTDHGPDPVTGLRVVQLTEQVAMATNIYGEDPACSALCNRAVFLHTYYSRCRGPVELWVHDFNTGLSQLVDLDMRMVERGAHAYSDNFFYFSHSSGGRELMRLNLSTLKRDLVHVLPGGHPGFVRCGAASADGRYYGNATCDSDNVFHIRLLDIETGEERIVASGEDLCNAHVCFDRVDGKTMFVQQNRGQRIGDNGAIETVDADIGATLFVVSVEDGKRTELPIAFPDFPGSISGHEAWVKGKHEIIYSIAGRYSPYEAEDGRRGNLFAYRLGDAAPRLIVDDPVYHGHVSTSECGRYWVNDRFDADAGGVFIAVGSIETGKWTNLCLMGGKMFRSEVGHAHPYMTPDKSRVLFGSTRTGSPQVFAVMVPDGLLDDLR